MSGKDRARQSDPSDQPDLEAKLAELYDLAVASFDNGDHGHTLQLLGQISKLKPSFEDSQKLRQRVAEALDREQRNVVFEEAKTKAEAALQQDRWDDVPKIVASMHNRLEAENLALSDTQRLIANQWSVSAGRRGGSRRAKRATQAKRRLKPPAASLPPPISAGSAPGTGVASAQKPPSLFRRNREVIIGCAVAVAFALVLAIIAALETSRSPDQVTEAADDLATEDPADETTPEVLEGIDRLRAIWADERQAVIEELSAVGRVDLAEQRVQGAARMEVDLSGCPPDWDNTGGIEDGVIRIAHTSAQSGTLAAYGQSAAGMAVYFDRVNERGGIGPDGLQVQLDIYDDEFNASRTAEIVEELVTTDEAFAVTTFGTQQTFATREALNSACIPQPIVASSHSAWADPNNFPWTTGLTMSYRTEARLWKEWIDWGYASGVVVAALVMDNDLGLQYERSFAEYAESSSTIDRVEFVRHDPAASSVTEEMETLAALNPTVFISMTAADPCRLAILAAAETGITETAGILINPSTCKDIPAVLGPAGDAADGWLMFGGGGRDLTDPEVEKGPYARYVREALFDAGLDPTDRLLVDGFAFRGWTLHQILEVAANLDGGLTRTNLLIAQWGLRGMTNPSLFGDIEFGTYGPRRPGFVEGSDRSRFDAAAQAWIFEGTWDLKNSVPPCSWVPGVGCT